jgi:hypothetical protein
MTKLGGPYAGCACGAFEVDHFDQHLAPPFFSSPIRSQIPACPGPIGARPVADSDPVEETDTMLALRYEGFILPAPALSGSLEGLSLSIQTTYN